MKIEDLILFYTVVGAVFIWVFKVIGVALPRYAIGLKDLRHFLIQSVNPEPIVTRVRTPRFPALFVRYINLRQVLIGSIFLFVFFWLARVTA